jgi:hypothetical protein
MISSAWATADTRLGIIAITLSFSILAIVTSKDLRPTLALLAD